MVILLIAFLFLPALMFMLKIFAHYNLIRNNDVEFKEIDFGQFFYSNRFSRKKIKISLKLYSLRFVKIPNELIDPEKDIGRINLYIKLTFIFLGCSALILLVGVFTETIK